MENNSIYQDVSNYYTNKINSYGPTPSGVDWNGKESQDLRFHELLKCLVPNQTITINDLGCGYGALVNFLSHSNNVWWPSMLNTAFHSHRQSKPLP